MVTPLRLALNADLHASRIARQHVTEHLAHFNATTKQVIEVIVGELVTNAVLHGRPPIHLSLTVDPTVRIEVYDANANMEPPTTESRGLTLVQNLATTFGTSRDGAGKGVWAELELDV